MRVKSFVRCRDQAPIEPVRRNTRFALAHQQDGLPAWIERKGDTPLAVADAEPQLLHVAMTRRLQRIGVRARQRWAEKLKRRNRGRGCFLHVMAPGSKLLGEFVGELDDPGPVTKYSLEGRLAPTPKEPRPAEILAE